MNLRRMTHTPNQKTIGSFSIKDGGNKLITSYVKQVIGIPEYKKLDNDHTLLIELGSLNTYEQHNAVVIKKYIDRKRNSNIVLCNIIDTNIYFFLTEEAVEKWM